VGNLALLNIRNGARRGKGPVVTAVEAQPYAERVKLQTGCVERRTMFHGWLTQLMPAPSWFDCGSACAHIKQTLNSHHYLNLSIFLMEFLTVNIENNGDNDSGNNKHCA
jgi:hypothetical protein